MGSPAASPTVIRFGAFEADLRTGELRKYGTRIKLQDQPFAVLAMLLERPGELVTREDIQKKLWPADTFVDFDHGLNTAVRRLRDALSDSADNPKWVETLPRRGYRFLGRIERTPEPEQAASSIEMTSPPEPKSGSGAPRVVSMPLAGETPALRPAAHSGRARLLTVIAAVVVIAGFLTWRFWPSWPDAIDSVAVLPFSNATNDAELEYLSDGIADSIMSNLSQVPMLRVMSRNSVMRYRGRNVDAKQAARELAVRAVLVGSMRSHGDDLHVSLELVDAWDGRQLWGADFDRKRGELLALQQEISQQTVERLRVRLSPETATRLARRHTPKPEAYDLYLRGRHALNKRTNADFQQALTFFQQAIDLDPTYADPYVGMSAGYGLMAFYGGMSPAVAYPKSEAAARRALELAPDSAETHVQMAYVQQQHRNAPAAEQEWQRAMALDPNSADAHHGYSMFLSSRGRYDEALREAALNEKLDPLWDGSFGTTADILMHARHYDEAIRKASAAGTGFAPDYWALGQLYLAQGKYEHAVAAFQQQYKIAGRGDFAQALLACGYARAGRKNEARALLEDALHLHKTAYFSPVNIASIYIALGDEKEAVAWLRTAVEERDPWLERLRGDPRFDPIRSTPEMQEIQRRLDTPI